MICSYSFHGLQCLHFLRRPIHKSSSICVIMQGNEMVSHLTVTMYLKRQTQDKIFNLDRMGGNTGIIHFVTYLGTALGAIIFGTIGENYGYDIPIILSGCTTLLAFVISYRLIHHLDHK